MDKIALNAMDRHGFMTDHKYAGGDSLNDLRSLYGRIKPSDTDYKSTIQSLIGFNKRDRLSVVNPTSKLVGVADFPRRMADHKPSLDEIRSKAAYKLGLSQNRYSGYGGHRIPSKIETNPALKDYMSRTKTASFDYDEMVKMAYEDIIEGFEKEASTAFDRYIKSKASGGEIRVPGSARKQLGDQAALTASTSDLKQMVGKSLSKAIASGNKEDVSIAGGMQYALSESGVPFMKNVLAGKKGKTLADIKASAAAKLGR